ncbi:hypothetical protein [Vagococcus sp.]|uniref:hypothetical protein n=1 Tax=Vagococcus sp. TaxID=1933889 RepID=UPI003F9589EA
MGLSPKPTNHINSFAWKVLDHWLKLQFESNTTGFPFADVNLNFYSLSKDEIINETKAKGYSVEDLGNNILRFT